MKSEFKQIAFSNNVDNYDYISNIRHIGDEAFYGCKGLSNVLILTSQIQSIGLKAFSNLNNTNIYYSNKISIDTSTFELTNAIKVQETKFSNNNLIQIDNSIFNKIYVQDLINSNIGENIDSIKNFIINNISNIFINYPVNILRENDLKPENIELNFYKSKDNKKIYITDIKLNYYYDQNGDIYKNNEFKNFGNVLLENIDQQISKIETRVINPIDANSLNLNNKFTFEAINNITSEFVFNNLKKFFIGDINVLSSNDVTIKNKYVSNNSIITTLELSEGSWYDQNGNLGTFSKSFTTLIFGFKSNDDTTINKNETKVINPIDASLLNLNNISVTLANNLIDNQYIYDNINIFLTGDYNIKNSSQIKIINKVLYSNSNYIDITFELSENTCYDSLGQLIATTKQFSTKIKNFKIENQKNETKIINPIDANILGWNNISVNEANEKISEEFIFNNLDKFFSGDYLVDSSNKIIINSKTISNNKLIISIKLSISTWYDQNGNLGNYEKLFSTIIYNFNNLDGNIYKPTKVINPIDANLLGLNNLLIDQVINEIDNNFIFKNIIHFLEGNYLINSSNEIVIKSKKKNDYDNSISIDFTLSNSTWYDENGKLGDYEKLFSTKIINFKNEKSETKIFSIINAANLNLDNNTVIEAKNKINNTFIYTKLSNFFTGDNNIKTENDIKLSSINEINNSLVITITLASNTWYDENGNLGTSEKTFFTIINNFKSSTNNPDNEENNKTTKINNPIEAYKLELSNYFINDAINLIDEAFIYKWKNIFLNGDNKINNPNQIININNSINNNRIILSFSLVAGSWYDDNGKLGTISKQFETEIINFKLPEIKKQTIIINPIIASNINLGNKTIEEAKNIMNNEYVFAYINNFFIGDINILNYYGIELSSIYILNNSINISIELKASTWYDENGKLGTFNKTFKTQIINFKNEIIEPDNSDPNNPNPDNSDNNINNPNDNIKKSSFNPWNKWYIVFGIGASISLATITVFLFIKKIIKRFMK